jgi:hypothetical protein
MLVGRPPFPAAAVQVMVRAHVHEPPPRRPSEQVPGLPPAVDAVIARALAKDPDERHAGAGELARDAQRALATAPAPFPPPRPPLPAIAISPPAPATVRRRRNPLPIALAGAVAVALTAAGAMLVLRDEATGAAAADASDSVITEPLASAGELPFQPGVGLDRDMIVPAGSAGTFSGDTPGLYGGSRGVGACDPRQLVGLLQRDPVKAAAWAAVHQIPATDLPGYVGRLTAVVLRSDTAVTDHRYRDGAAQPFQAILQAGTSVLVDDRGVPRTKCFSGNPLDRPRPPVEPHYTGPAWASFSPSAVTTIDPAARPVVEFTVVDPPTTEVFQRAAGSNGDRDR